MFKHLRKKCYRSLSYKKIFIEDKNTGRVNILKHTFEKIAKKSKLKSQDSKNVQSNLPKKCFSGPVTIIFNFFTLFSKMCHSKSTLLVILSL